MSYLDADVETSKTCDDPVEKNFDGVVGSNERDGYSLLYLVAREKLEDSGKILGRLEKLWLAVDTLGGVSFWKKRCASIVYRPGDGALLKVGSMTKLWIRPPLSPESCTLHANLVRNSWPKAILLETKREH